MIRHLTVRVAAILFLLLFSQAVLFAQDASGQTSALPQNGPLGRLEVPDTEENRQFVEAHSLDNPSFRQKQGGTQVFEAEPFVQGSKQVRIIYLVPQDKIIRADYSEAMAKAIADLQVFYRNQLTGGLGFSIHAPTVEIYQTTHTSAYYSTGDNARAGGFWETVLADGFALTGGGFNDPDNRWIFYVDADLVCGQYTGGTSGVALLPANDLRGLTSQTPVPTCPSDSTYVWPVGRWIGGLGHELGHAFGLPHPPGCDSGSCTGGTTAYNSLMYIGYSTYPNTYLLSADKTTLRALGFFSVLTLNPTAKYDITGRVTNSNNTAIAGATVSISETHESVLTDANGNYRFDDLLAGGTYTVSVAKSGYSFTPAGVFFNNLDRNRTFNFQSTQMTYDISGRVTQDGAGLSGVTVTLSGAQAGTTTTDSSGNYSFAVAAYGDYTVKPSKTGYFFSPSEQTVNQLSGNVRVGDFVTSRSAVQFSARAYSASEAASGALITVKRVGDISGSATVNYATADGTAAAGSDYTAAAGTLTFGPSETTKTFTVPVLSDVLDEDNETINLTLGGAGGAAVVSPGTAVLTITDNDAAPGLKVDNVTAAEANTGTNTTATFTVSLTAPSSRSVTVSYATVAATAAESVDYMPAAGTLTFAPGQTSKAVAVKVKGDSLDEADETFKLALSFPSNATIAVGQGTCTITDNDLPPGVRINNAVVTEADSGAVSAAVFTVSLSAPSGRTVTVKYATANSTAVAPADYTPVAPTTLTFAPGEMTKTVAVSVKGDLLDEVNESFKVLLSGPVNATVATGQGTCTITDNDAAPTMTITDATVTEPDTGAISMVFTIKLSAPSGRTVTVKYATGGGVTGSVATAGTDYTAVALTTLTFLPGQTSKTVTVQAKGDTLKELNETFYVNLSGAAYASVTDAHGLGTILNDD
jgi:hypothetical protein